MRKILLVEDEVSLGDTIQLSVQKMGFHCDWVKTLKDAKSKLRTDLYDLLVVDWNLPDGEGVSLLAHPKRDLFRVLILSSKSSVAERVEGLKRGADDYLPKPFSFHELEARIHALLRRSALPVSSDRKYWEIDTATLCVQAPTGNVMLTPLELKFLQYLIEREGTIVSKDRLLRDVWGFSFLPKTRTVDYLITQLRKRIEPDPEVPRHLLTIRGAGVKFVA